MAGRTPSKSRRPMTVASLVCLCAAVVLFLNAALFAGMLLAWGAVLATDAAASVAAALLLLVGLGVYLAASRRGAQRLYRRLLVGAMVANGLIVLFYLALLLGILYYVMQN